MEGEKKEMTEEEKLCEQAEMLAFLNDPEEKKNAVSLALQIQECVGKNWFRWERFLQKTGETAAPGEIKIKLCLAFETITIRKNSRGLIEYKVTVSNNDKIVALNEIIDYHKEQIISLERRRDSLKPEPATPLDDNVFSSKMPVFRPLDIKDLPELPN